MNKEDKFKEQLKQIIREEYRGFKKNQGFRTVKDKTDNDGFDKVEYIPKFTDIRRKLKEFASEFKPYKQSQNSDIADLGKDITTTFTQLGQFISILDQKLRLNGR